MESGRRNRRRKEPINKPKNSHSNTMPTRRLTQIGRGSWAKSWAGLNIPLPITAPVAITPICLNAVGQSKAIHADTAAIVIRAVAVAAASGMMTDSHETLAGNADLYNIRPYGNVSLMHMTDRHAQLVPIYFRKPNVNSGVSRAEGRVPHLMGRHLLKKFGIKPGSLEAHAF
jgi:hypothetical protein